MSNRSRFPPKHATPGLIVQGAWWGVVLNPFGVDAQVVQEFQILRGARSPTFKPPVIQTFCKYLVVKPTHLKIMLVEMGIFPK